VMGSVNPFFERAGMTAYTAPMPTRCAQMSEAFSMAGVEKNMLIDPQKVQRTIDRLQRKNDTPAEAIPKAPRFILGVKTPNIKLGAYEFIELQIRHFLQSYGKRRNMPAGMEQTRFVLSKLTERPTYYIWFNKEVRS